MAKQEVEVKVIVDGEKKETEKFLFLGKVDIPNMSPNIVLNKIVLNDGSERLGQLSIYLDDMGIWFEEHKEERIKVDRIYLAKCDDGKAILYEYKMEFYSVRVITNEIMFSYVLMQEIPVNGDNVAMALWKYLTME